MPFIKTVQHTKPLAWSARQAVNKLLEGVEGVAIDILEPTAVQDFFVVATCYGEEIAHCSRIESGDAVVIMADGCKAYMPL